MSLILIVVLTTLSTLLGLAILTSYAAFSFTVFDGEIDIKKPIVKTKKDFLICFIPLGFFFLSARRFFRKLS